MATPCSFDITSNVDLQEVDNALSQARKEVAQRYDFKGTKCTIELDKKEGALKIDADDDYRLKQVMQVLREKLSKRAMRSKRPLSMLFLDLDGFKSVNDTHGHLYGSKALVEAGAVIRDCARETDVVARFGGDEFALILPDTGPGGAKAVALRIRERIKAHHFLASDGLSVRLTASIGVATLPDAAQTAEELLKAADMAMYKVKAAGKDGIHVAQE